MGTILNVEKAPVRGESHARGDRRAEPKNHLSLDVGLDVRFLTEFCLTP
jgi:hypothetical protein